MTRMITISHYMSIFKTFSIIFSKLQLLKLLFFCNMAHLVFRNDSFKTNDRTFNILKQITSYKNKNKTLVKRYEKLCIYICVRGRQKVTKNILHHSLIYCHSSTVSKTRLICHLQLFSHSYFSYSFKSTLVNPIVNSTSLIFLRIILFLKY